MRNLESISKKIKSIKTTSKITFAMQMVATAKLQRFKKLNKIYFDYLTGFYEIFANVYHDVNHEINDTNKILMPWLKSHNDHNKKTLFIVIGSDIGMCGGFNTNLFKKIKDEIKNNDQIYLFGAKIEWILNSQLKKDIKIVSNFKFIEGQLQFRYVALIAERIFRYFLENQFDSLKIVYTKYYNSLSFEPTIFEILPFTNNYFEKNGDNKEFAKIKKEFEIKTNNLNSYELYMTPSTFIEKNVWNYIAVYLYGAILDSKISETSARYNSMLTATDNAKDLIENYQLEFNRYRQAAITQEIIEIINGSSS